MKRGEVQGFGGVKIMKVSSCVQGFHPIGWRQASLEHEATDDVVGGADDAFNFSVLRGCVGA